MTSDTFLLRCPECRAKNRIPAAKADLMPKCGRCGKGLDTGVLRLNRPTEVTDSNFVAEVDRSPLPVLLDCWADWCGPCRMVGPIIDGLASELRGRIKTAKLNVDQNPKTSARFQIRSIPTLLVFDRGQLVDTMVGALPKEEIVKRVNRFFYS